jgi:transcriptional regulator with XRE-family HTH domain
MNIGNRLPTLIPSKHFVKSTPIIIAKANK